jgi:hypothetical protein
LQQNPFNPSSQGGISGRLAAARADALNADSSLPQAAPRQDGRHSMAEMAQRDLDAALQLLADRAQYITGATGAAIALLQKGRKDMLCRASTGPNAPELGALLSTEFGLSGESVRTKQLLRCDDAERDARVNREVCRQRGIASVVVMPVVNDDEVLGVFELFSGRAHAFADRDVSAVQRLSEMVETAVRLARAAERLPGQLKNIESLATDAPRPVDSLKVEEDSSEEILDEEIFAEPPVQAKPGSVEPRAQVEAAKDGPVAPASVSLPAPSAAIERLPKQEQPKPAAEPIHREIAAGTRPASEVHKESSAPPKKLFWSAAVSASAESERTAEADLSHVPPVMRALRKCEACGFPITAGRVLCVECEEKKWRGQLKRPADTPRAVQPPIKTEVATVKPQALAAAAHGTAKMNLAPSASASAVGKLAAASPAGKEPSLAKAQIAGEAANPNAHDVAAEPRPKADDMATPAFDFSGGLGSSQSWFSANKYVLLVLLVVAAIIAALYLR